MPPLAPPAPHEFARCASRSSSRRPPSSLVVPGEVPPGSNSAPSSLRPPSRSKAGPWPREPPRRRGRRGGAPGDRRPLRTASLSDVVADGAGTVLGEGGGRLSVEPTHRRLPGLVAPARSDRERRPPPVEDALAEPPLPTARAPRQPHRPPHDPEGVADGELLAVSGADLARFEQDAVPEGPPRRRVRGGRNRQDAHDRTEGSGGSPYLSAACPLVPPPPGVSGFV